MESDKITSTFQRLRQRLLGTAVRITGNSDDAADAVQDAFVKLWTRRDSLDDLSDGVAVVTVRNLSIDARRQADRHPRESLEQTSIAAESTSSDDDRRSAYREVMSIIEHQITPIQRQVLMMRDMEECSFDEIAQQLGITPENARMSLSRARKAVRECYRKRVKQ